ncbi:MAG: sulfide/dihydroorotate dehydrogenase-like FAD/NAD-binding protein [Candidatus Omnitrophica bacterium]|nr:sulfide/dihydroorotate dehydrogenase-like FAD/NAD-binding protein [Candidatus Omnitrophota bacterium]
MQIVEKNILTPISKGRIVKLKLFAPQIAQKAKPGQFVVLMVTKEGERIPLTIADTDKNTITIIFQEVGLTTTFLGRLGKKDSLYALVGPLGNPTEIQKYGKVIMVGGGVGIAEIYPVIKAFKNVGNYIISILGARTKNLLILEKEIKKFSDEFYVTTDDGSYGQKGFVLDILKNLLNKNLSEDEYQLIYAVGPIPMMENVANLTKSYNIKTIVSLNALMVDATGMCGCCRVTVGGKTKFSCIDGPEFDAHQIEWGELAKRNNVYREKENHICKLLLKLEQ